MICYIFWGSTPSAAYILNSLVHSKKCIKLVVTQPPKPFGRNRQQQPTAVHQMAERLGIEVIHPLELNDKFLYDRLKKIEPHFFIVVAYGKILPSALLSLPKKTSINLHYSLLPRWRGASPIQTALWQGDKKTGVTAIQMVKQLDAGDILLQKPLAIDYSDTSETLQHRLTILAVEVLEKVLDEFDTLKKVSQNEAMVTYTKKIYKSQGEINWEQSAEKIYLQYRALNPQPGIFSFWKKKKIFLRKISLACIKESDSRVGLLEARDNRLYVNSECGSLEIIYLQREGKKEVSAKEFINGEHIRQTKNNYFGKVIND